MNTQLELFPDVEWWYLGYNPLTDNIDLAFGRQSLSLWNDSEFLPDWLTRRLSNSGIWTATRVINFQYTHLLTCERGDWENFTAKRLCFIQLVPIEECYPKGWGLKVIK